jgi:outer membrane protein assembly factor BamB
MYGSDGFVSDPRSKLTCLNISTGEKMWTKELGPTSLIATNDKLIVLNEKYIKRI